MSFNLDYVTWYDDFLGGQTFGTSLSEGAAWKITDTSSAGTPTYAVVSPSATGEVALTLAATNEIENVCLDFGDVLSFDIDNIQRYEARVKVSGVTSSATSVAFGLQSARNDNTDSTTNNIQFKLAGSLAVVCESDDGTNDNDDKSSGVSMVAATYRKFMIDFSQGKKDVRFYIDGQRVAASTTFDMSNATGSLQPFFQIQKTAATNADAVTVDVVAITCKR
jgi:hypothetical protein